MCSLKQRRARILKPTDDKYNGNINQDTARQEILKTIPAAVGFSSIHYHHRQRPSYDIRFTVRSLEQYQTALLTGYRLTYCTACWKIGHMRDKSQSSVSCREVSRPFQQHANDFPLLNQAKEMSDLLVTIKALSETMIRTEKSFNDLNNRIEAQHKSTVLHCNSICAIIDTVQIMSSWVQDSVLTQWENNPCPLSNQFIPLNVLTYNVQGWGTRALEVIDLIFKFDSPVCVFTEVGELWNSFKVPHFTSFYQKGTNHSGGVMITIGKHLRATRIDTDIENTVVVDIHGLSEQIRIIGIYWPQGQMRNLKDLSPFLVKGTILTDDFNATSDEWGSQSTDRR
ncbi:unnamed protein product, partial [Rotaria magnacalcarata]